MISVIGLTIDVISFIFAMVVLPICTLAFWLTYDDPTLDLEQDDDPEAVTQTLLKGDAR